MTTHVLARQRRRTGAAATGAPAVSAGDGLLHPIALLAVALLLVNDHLLKAAAPGPLTGKLSDLAGLIVLPLVVLAGLEVAAVALHRSTRPGARTALVVVVAVGVGFAATKLTFIGADAYRLGLGVLQWPLRALGAAAAGGAVGGPSPVSFVADPTDIVVVPILLVPLALALARGSPGRRTSSAAGPSSRRRSASSTDAGQRAVEAETA